MSVDKVFERRKGTRKIPVEDVATLVRIAGNLREACAELEGAYAYSFTGIFRAHAADLDLIVARCGGSPYEEESDGSKA